MRNYPKAILVPDLESSSPGFDIASCDVREAVDLGSAPTGALLAVNPK